MNEGVPIVCDLGALSVEGRARETALLAEFKTVAGAAVETETGYRFTVPGDAGTLARLAEFLALERQCCPFLAFELAVPAGRGPLTVHIHGAPGVKAFVRATFRD